MNMFPYDDRIITTSEYGVHIELTCKNHPSLRWNTKNIAPIGARTIFYNGDINDGKGMQTPECHCSVTMLIPVALVIPLPDGEFTKRKGNENE